MDMEQQRNCSHATENKENENDARMKIETEKFEHFDSPSFCQSYEDKEFNGHVQDAESEKTEFTLRSRSPSSSHGEESRALHHVVYESESLSNDVSEDSDPEYKPLEKKMAKDQTEQKKYRTSKSKIAPFLSEHQLWQWHGKSFIKHGTKGRGKKRFFKTIVRGLDMINIGDCAVFFSTGQTDQPYVGRIERMWESVGNMVVRAMWFYHPEETKGLESTLIEPEKALFESSHFDENDVQTISHKCDVIHFPQYCMKVKELEEKYGENYDSSEIYYLAGFYNPTTEHLTIEPCVLKD